MSYRKWTRADSDNSIQAERAIGSLSDFVECVKEIFEENKRSVCFWSSLAMIVFLWVLYFVVVPMG